MATFLVRYSTAPSREERADLPLQGSTVELNSLEDFDAFAQRVGGERLILFPPGTDYAPHWAESLDQGLGIWDADDAESYHTVTAMPEGWKSLRWIEIYNSLRE